jgi:hypothetical protein
MRSTRNASDGSAVVPGYANSRVRLRGKLHPRVLKQTRSRSATGAAVSEETKVDEMSAYVGGWVHLFEDQTSI